MPTTTTSRTIRVSQTVAKGVGTAIGVALIPAAFVYGTARGIGIGVKQALNNTK